MFFIWSVFCLFVVLVLLVRWLVQHFAWFSQRLGSRALRHAQFLWVALLPATLGWWGWRGMPTVDTSAYYDTPWAYLWVTSNFWSLLGWMFTAIVTHLCLFHSDGGRSVAQWFGYEWLMNLGPIRFWGPANYPLYSWMAVTILCAIMVWLQGIPDAGPNLLELGRYRVIGPAMQWLASWFVDSDVVASGLTRYPRHWWWVVATVISLLLTALSFPLTRGDEARDAWRRVVDTIRLRFHGPAAATAATAAVAPPAGAAAPPTAVRPEPAVRPEGRGWFYWGMHALNQFVIELLAAIGFRR